MNLIAQIILLVIGMVLIYFSERVGRKDKWEYLRSMSFIIGLLTTLHFSMSISQDLGFNILLALLLGGAVSMLLLFLRHELSGKKKNSDSV